MRGYTKTGPTAVVIFGAGGDLTWRKLVPALYNLHLDRLVEDRFAIIGVDRKEMSDDDFRRHLRQGVDEHSRRGKADPAIWDNFALHVSYIISDFSNDEVFKAVAARLGDLDRQWNTQAARLFYLAIPPSLIETIVVNLGRVQLARDNIRNRIIVEKPFGRDLDSARELNRCLTQTYEEGQIYRIDHYLGKETVQNILAFRFANSLFEPVWNRRYIDHVQITVSETVGVEHRGGYYEQAGALRDIVQNHLLQVLCLTAMEPPVSYNPDEIRNKKVDVLRAIRPILPEHVAQVAVRGQYGAGWMKGDLVRAYRKEPDVEPESSVETYAAVKFFVDNWRWQDVPFYVRTGKRMPVRVSNVIIQFKPVPHQSFPTTAITEPQPNRLEIRIQPEEGIALRFQAKHPGESVRLSPVDMRFMYRDSFHTAPPEAYETLLLDVMLGDLTQFMRADQLEAAWATMMPILDAWGAVTPTDFPNYAAGTWGPEAAEVVIARDGRSWIQPEIKIDERELEKPKKLTAA